jgi:hypothetical protein
MTDASTILAEHGSTTAPGIAVAFQAEKPHRFPERYLPLLVFRLSPSWVAKPLICAAN